MKFFSLIWGNLKRKKLRTGLTVMSILVAFLLYGILCVMKQALSAGVSLAGADRLITRHKVSIIQLLPVSYKERISRVPGVAAVATQTWFGGIYQDPKNFFMSLPVDPQEYLSMYPEFVLPKDQRAAWLAKRTGAIVGKSTAERFEWKIGDKIPLKSPIWRHADGSDAWEFDLVGIYDGAKKGTDTTGFFFQYDYFDEGRVGGKGMVGWYTVRVQDPARAAEVARAIDREFENSPYETKTETEAAMAQGWAQQIGDIGSIMLGIQSAVFFTILLVAGNNMTQAVHERTEEIGVLKAIGFSDGLVLALVLCESIAIAAAGGLVGLGLTWLMTSGGSPIPTLFPVLYFPPTQLAVGLGLVLLLGLVTGAVPAVQAMRMGVADALRRAT